MRYLFLTDPAVCPACHCKTKPKHFRECSFCKTLLFLRPINFQHWEDEGGARHYWCFVNSTKGWMHRDYLMAKDQPAPQARECDVKIPPLNNSTTPEQVAARGGRQVITRRK